MWDFFLFFPKTLFDYFSPANLAFNSYHTVKDHCPMIPTTKSTATPPCFCWDTRPAIAGIWNTDLNHLETNNSVLMIACTLHRRPFRFDLIWWSIGRIFAQPSHSGESLMWKWLQLFVSYVPTVSQAFIITYTLSSFCHYCPSITSLLHWVSALSIW